MQSLPLIKVIAVLAMGLKDPSCFAQEWPDGPAAHPGAAKATFWKHLEKLVRSCELRMQASGRWPEPRVTRWT